MRYQLNDPGNDLDFRQTNSSFPEHPNQLRVSDPHSWRGEGGGGIVGAWNWHSFIHTQ